MNYHSLLLSEVLSRQSSEQVAKTLPLIGIKNGQRMSLLASGHMMFLGLHKLENIWCGHKMFLDKIRNIFSVLDTKFVSATNVARTCKRGNICVGNNVSATMCHRLPGP